LLKATVEHFRNRGEHIERVMTDNGPAYVSKAFPYTYPQLAIRHVRTRPCTPRTNGRAARFIQTCLREWLTPRPTSAPLTHRSSADLAASLQLAACSLSDNVAAVLTVARKIARIAFVIDRSGTRFDVPKLQPA
jgi:transposase InsO family protein